jgi:hypothetical protein
LKLRWFKIKLSYVDFETNGPKAKSKKVCKNVNIFMIFRNLSFISYSLYRATTNKVYFFFNFTVASTGAKSGSGEFLQSSELNGGGVKKI